MKWKNMNSVKVFLFVAFILIGVGSAKADCYFDADVVCEGQMFQSGRQGRGHFDPVKFRKDLEDYIAKEAGLTPEEAKKFFPVFHKSKMELRKLSRDMAMASMRIKKE